MRQTLLPKRAQPPKSEVGRSRLGAKFPGSGLGLHPRNTQELIRELQKGFPFKTLEALASHTGTHPLEIASVLSISERTLARRRAIGRFASDESERLLRLSRIFELAVELFHGDIRTAATWLRTPRKALGDNAPFEYSATELGAREVETLIGQLVHGIFP
jgi:putative toxin-antitoxin system antitoxin component (TIGR02293 family)